MIVRYFAGAAQAAGVAQETVTVDASATMRDLCDAISANREQLKAVLEQCVFLADETRVDLSAVVGTCEIIDVLPPFAGG